MALEVKNRWLTIRIDGDDDRAMLYASASDGTISASGSWPLELPRQLVKDLRDVIKEHGDVADDQALAALHESRRINAGGVPPDGVKAIKLDGGIGMRGDATRRKD